MTGAGPHPVVHVELHTPDLRGARSFYEQLLGWRAELVEAGSHPYVSVDVGLSGGMVECGTLRPLWIPYVEVPDVRSATARAMSLGASTLLPPREGPTGWRAVLSSGAGGEVAFWQAGVANVGPARQGRTP
jgi:predicted enzyme related to lactoylglutathione lyase